MIDQTRLVAQSHLPMYDGKSSMHHRFREVYFGALDLRGSLRSLLHLRNTDTHVIARRDIWPHYDRSRVFESGYMVHTDLHFHTDLTQV